MTNSLGYRILVRECSSTAEDSLSAWNEDLRWPKPPLVISHMPTVRKARAARHRATETARDTTLIHPFWGKQLLLKLCHGGLHLATSIQCVPQEPCCNPATDRRSQARCMERCTSHCAKNEMKTEQKLTHVPESTSTLI